MAITALTFMRKRPGLSDDDFDRHWSGAHADLVRELPGLRAYTQARPHPDARAPQRVDGLAFADFDDVAALRAASASPAYAAVRADESRFVDPRALVTLVVRRREVPVPRPSEPRHDAVLFIGVMHRRPGLDRDAYLRHWGARHADLASGLPALQRYEHLVPVPLRGEPAYDGVAALWFPTMRDLLSAFRSDGGRAVRADEPTFVDDQRSFALFLVERPVGVP